MFVLVSLEGEVCAKPSLGPKKDMPLPPGDTVDVGEGKTSLNRVGASLRSGFHIPVPHVKLEDPEFRPITGCPECGPQGPATVSPEGVLGCDAVGDMELLANEPFRGRPKGCDVSFSHEERRTGLG